MTNNSISPYRSYATPPATPLPSNLPPTNAATLNDLTSPTPPSFQPPFPGRSNPRRTAFNPNRPIPTLRREKSVFGEDSALGEMVLSSAGYGLAPRLQPGNGDFEREFQDESELLEVGMKSGWMVARVGEDNGSQFTQESGSSQLLDSQFSIGTGESQPLQPTSTSYVTRALNPYRLPAGPALSSSSGSASLTSSPSRPQGSRRGPIRHQAGSPGRRSLFSRERETGGLVDLGEE
ncbi:hypothetical protein BDZ91DRAFT_796572 [Kalaharituber pfeilii]|nr:hypothetical protein BDZ91DRAFT_796572 [Kalaharituber pfeilii]